jgi:Do/DeqQ family serine protease
MRRVLAAAFLLASALAAAPAAAQAPALRVTPQSRGDAVLSFSPVVKAAQPAVANVYASRTDARPRNPLFDDPIFERFFGHRGQQPGGPTSQSLGSGVIVDASGFVVTNNHVIDGMTEVKVALADRREFEADIVLRDPRTDLAVLKIKGATGFPYLELGDSDALEVGDLVLALGNPFGVGQTVTQGIVSGLARTQVGISDYGFFIQTDAAINPGNSGGALVDMQARLIGVNSAIYSKSGGSVGIGFAIPVNMVKTVIAAAKSGGKAVRRPWLGATMQNVSKEIADSLGLDRPIGALITDLAERSPAAEAGLKRGDIIVAIDGQAVGDPEALGFRLGTKTLGGAATLNVLRGGKSIVAPIRLVVAPELPPREAVKLKTASPLRGATVVNLSPAVVEELGVENARAGVAIAELEDGSSAAAMNFQKGDVVLGVNDAKIGSTRDLEQATAKGRYFWKITIERAGQVLTTVVGG